QESEDGFAGKISRWGIAHTQIYDSFEHYADFRVFHPRMTSKEIRQSFLEFFRERGHEIVPSAPVIPHGDKTLLFTNAGMNQFKDVFLGVGSRSYTRAADTQKVIRVSGKHNHLEEV